MKKFFSIFTLLLMLLGIGTVSASVIPSDDLAKISNGDEMFLSVSIARPAADATVLPTTDAPYYYYCDLFSGAVKVTSTPQAFYLDNYVWVAELAETDADGNQWFYLKNKWTNLYMGHDVPANASPTSPASDGETGFWYDDEAQTDLQWGAHIVMVEKAKACPFTFKHPIEGTKFIGRTVDTALLSQGMDLLMPITYFKDATGATRYMMLNYAYGAYYSSYADFACWFTASEAYVDDNSSIDDQILIFMEMLPTTSYLVGDYPGCLSDAAVAEEYNAAYEAASDIANSQEPDAAKQAAFDRLLAAAKAAAACDIIPMHAGNFRIISAFAGFEASQGVQKAMGVDNNGNPNWSDLNTGTAAQVWIFTESSEAGKFYMKNLKTGTYVTGKPGQSSAYTATAEATNTVQFTDKGNGIFTIRTTGCNWDMHTNSHGGGSGQSGNIVGWNTGYNGTSGTTDGSVWIIRPVSDYEMQELDAEAKQAMLDNAMATLLNNATRSYNSSLIMPEYEGIVTDASWISSPYTETSEGSIEALLDGNTGTFWHSSWQGGALEMMVHYLQFDLQKGYNLATMEYCRRNGAANDWPTSFVLYGVDDPNAENDLEASDSIGRIVLNDPASLEIQLAPSIDLKGHRYIRVYCDAVGGGYQRGYWHAAEMNFIEGEVKPSFLDNLKAAGEALGLAIEAAKAVETVTQSDIDALQAAYDAFLQEFANPAELNAAIARAQTAKNGAYVGEGEEVGLPGTITQDAVDALAAVLAEAEAYAAQDVNLYTKDGLAQHANSLNEALAVFNASIIMPDTKHWYHISCPTVHNEKVEYNPVDNLVDPNLPLTGTLVTVDGDVSSTSGAQMHMVAIDTLRHEDNALWRFVAITDSSYAIQNKGTGLYINLTATTGPRALTTVPGMFRFAPYADRVFNLVGTSIDGELESCLHMQTQGHVVVAWPTRGDAGLNNGSSWQIDPVEEVEEEIIALNQSIAQNRLYAMCYPFGVESTDEGAIYTISYIGKDGVGLSVNDNAVQPGEPFFYMNDQKASNDTTVVSFRVMGGDMTSVAGTAANDVLVGTFVGVNPGAGKGSVKAVKNDEGKIVNTINTNAASVAAGEAYINVEGLGDNMPNGDYEILIAYTGTPLADAIEAAIANVAPVKGIYTISGHNLGNDIKALKPGMYIVNGKKVIVK